MVVAVEILRGDKIRYAVECVVVEQQCTEQRLLGLDGMGRNAQRKQLRVAGLRPCGCSVSRRILLCQRHPAPPLLFPGTRTIIHTRRCETEDLCDGAAHHPQAGAAAKKTFLKQAREAAKSCGRPVDKLSINCAAL